MIINLTAHPLVLLASDGEKHTIPSSGVARVITAPGTVRNIGLPVPVADATEYGDVTGLPDPKMTCGCGAGPDCPSADTGDIAACPHAESTYYVVSAVAGAAIRASGSTRADVLCPGTGPYDGAVRDEDGQITAVTRLVRATHVPAIPAPADYSPPCHPCRKCAQTGRIPTHRYEFTACSSCNGAGWFYPSNCPAGCGKREPAPEWTGCDEHHSHPDLTCGDCRDRSLAETAG